LDISLPSETFNSLLQALPDAVLIADNKGMINMCNDQLAGLFGYRKQELIGQSVHILVPEAQRNLHRQKVARYMTKPNRRNMGKLMSLAGQRKDGELVSVDIMLSPVTLEGKSWVICSIRDISEIKRLQSELQLALEKEQKLARLDSLTHIANRRAFYEFAEKEKDRSLRHHLAFTLAYIDLDNFKLVNDRFGHDTGDQLLKMVASNIKNSVRSSDMLARLGGDEFGVILPETAQPVARKMITRLIDQLGQRMAENQWPVTFSVGVLTCNNGHIDVEELMRKVDSLMYQIKHRGKNAVKYCIE
jgi:diguanylate cyclase (GGDEF)-like protein/PAS domain S-box-containing protein